MEVEELEEHAPMLEGEDPSEPPFETTSAPKWRDLPPLPEPRHSDRNGEAAMGCAVVGSIVFGCVVATHTGVSLLGDERAGLARALLALVYVESAIALACLLGLLCGDPGVIKRGEAACLPMPREVATCLAAGGELEGLQRNIRRADGATYCVRCLVWRHPGRRGAGGADDADAGAADCGEPHLTEYCGPPSDAHHCSTCQRCVRHFDHHCGVFGRCIAGRGLSGNMKYFVTIIFVGWAGGATAAAAAVLGAGVYFEGTPWAMVVWRLFLYGIALYAAVVAIACAISGGVWLVRHIPMLCAMVCRCKAKRGEDDESAAPSPAAASIELSSRI